MYACLLKCVMSKEENFEFLNHFFPSQLDQEANRNNLKTFFSIFYKTYLIFLPMTSHK